MLLVFLENFWKKSSHLEQYDSTELTGSRPTQWQKFVEIAKNALKSSEIIPKCSTNVAFWFKKELPFEIA